MHGLESLIHLGLTPQEARLYLSLNGSARPALEIAAETGLARSRVYQVLGALTSLGLVERDGATYRALDLSSFVLRRQQDLLRELRRLEDLQRAVPPEPLSARVVSEDELLPLAARALNSGRGVAMLRAASARPYMKLPAAAWTATTWRLITDDASWLPSAALAARHAVRIAPLVGPCFGATSGAVHILSGEATGLLVQSPSLAREFGAVFEAAWSRAAPH